MMKKRWILMLMVLAVMCFAATAAAEIKTIDLVSDRLYLTAGRAHTVMPPYRDYSSQFGSNYTQEDFNITYTTEYVGVTVDPDGTLHISEDAPEGTIVIKVKYVLKRRPSQTRTNEYRNVMLVKAPTRLELNPEIVCTNMDAGAVVVSFDFPYGKAVLESVSYDAEMLDVDVRTYNLEPYNMSITPLQVGESEIILRSMNDLVKTLKVVVVEKASKVELAVDHVVCKVGDIIDLGIDLGNGPYGVAGLNPGMFVRENGESANDSRFKTNDYRFRAFRPGLFEVKISSNGHSDTATFEVYQEAACVDIEQPMGSAVVGNTSRLILRDENGKDIFRPAVFSGDVKVYALNGYWYVTPSAEGEYTVTVTNPDGSTYAETFAIQPQKPTMIELAAYDLTMQIGETFDLNPTLNAEGDFVCEYTITDLNSEYYYGVVCVRVEDGTIIAQGPGKARVHVECGDASRTCYVTVEESDAQIELVYSEYPLGAGRTVQVSVQDKTGKVYPATFLIERGSYVTVTPDGQLTATHPNGSYRLYAMLEDGRRLSSGDCDVVIYPKWLHCNNIVLTMDDSKYFDGVMTDQGYEYREHFIVEIADPSIVELSTREFWPLSPGVTEVTVTSKYNGVSTTFLIEVVDDNTLYAGSTYMHIPYGFSSYMPVVTNASGKEVSVKWTITQNTPGEGNPEESAFKLDGNTITCVWPDGSCIVTGKASNGATVKVTVHAYYMPEYLVITPETINLNIGDSQRLNVTWDDPYAQVKTVYWIADTEGIITYQDVVPATDNTIHAKAAGTTYLMALLDNGAYGICQVNVTNPHARLPGDANEDGAVDYKDALLIMQYAAGWNLSINGYAADVNVDGKVTVEDAILVFQHDSGLDVELRQYIPAP